MILSDREIEAALDNKLIRIHPRPERKLWTSTAIDLTLDTSIWEWKEPQPHPSGQPNYVRPHGENFDVLQLMRDSNYATALSIEPNNGYILRPGQFVLGYTREVIHLLNRSRLAA